MLPPATCIEELYEFSKWDKFTKGRPKIRVFYHGKTYTYEKLPSFPKIEKKPKSKPISKRTSEHEWTTGKETVVS